MAKLLTQSHSFGRAVENISATRAPVTAASYESPGALDCRRVLGVGPGASKREVKAAYRKLALQFHPDVIRGDAEVSFSEVNRAYESLITALDERAADNDISECESSREEEDDPWADFVDGLVDGYQPREDFSHYYSNLKLYSKGRKYQYYQGNW